MRPSAPPTTRARSADRSSIAWTCTWTSIRSAPPILPCPRRQKAAPKSRRRVTRARVIQTERLDGTGLRTNAELDGDSLEAHATPDEAGRKLLLEAAEAMRLSARGYTRILRVARTIADLGGTPVIGRIHVAEALSYRRRPPRA